MTAGGFAPQPPVVHPPSIYVDVFTPDGITFLGQLPDAFARQWRDVHNDVGQGSIRIPARKPDGTLSDEAVLCQADRIIRFGIDNIIRYGIVVAARDRDSIDQQEEPQQDVIVNGPGLLSLTANAVLLPELGIGRLSPSHRLFNFASHYYDDSAWTAAVQIKLQSDHSSSGVGLQWRTADGHSAPSAWPDPNAWWIWSRAQIAGSSMTPPQPVGDTYYRKSFTLAGLTPCSIFITADDGFELYLDDASVAAETRAFMWNQTRRVDVLLDAGTHYLAIKGTNIQRDSVATNIAGVLCTVMQTDQGGSAVSTVIVHTDNTWKADDYPAAAPTMTPGQILKICIDEAQALGFLPGITYDFTASHDSNGNAWSVPVDVGYDVGTSVLDIIRNLVGVAIDIHMNPATLVLSAYNTGTYGTATAVALQHGVHFTNLKHQADPALVTDILAQYHTGIWVLKTSGGSPKKAAFLSLGSSPSDDQVNRQVAQIFATSGIEITHATWTCLPITGAAPYVDWKPGDTITIPDDEDDPTTTRVLALIVSEPSPAQDGVINGTVLYAAEGIQ